MLRQPTRQNKILKISPTKCQQHPQNKCNSIKTSAPFMYQLHKLINQLTLELICEKCVSQQINQQFVGKLHNKKQSSDLTINLQDQNSVNNYLTIQEFQRSIEKLVKDDRSFYNNIQFINVRQIIDHRRRELLSYYDNARISIIEKLNNQQQQINRQLNMIQQYYCNKQRQILEILQKKNKLISYFQQFTKDSTLLTVKLNMSCQTGLDGFLAEMKKVQAMQQQLISRSILTRIKEIHEDINKKLSSSFLFKIQRSLRDCPKFQPICINKDCFLPNNSRNSSREKSPALTQRYQRNRSSQNLPTIPQVPKTSRHHQRSFANLPRPRTQNIINI